VFLLSPVAVALTTVSNIIIKAFGGKPPEKKAITEEEIKTMLKIGEEEGTIEKDERKMIYEIFEFDETKTKEVMIPRKNIVCILEDKTVGDVINIVKETGFSRIPVYRNNIDNIIGMIHVKDTLKLDKDVPISNILRPILRIKTTEKVDEVLREMQRKRTHIAVVTDENNKTVGLVSMEDLIEEIVGEIADDYEG
jgi:putative hemolysin